MRLNIFKPLWIMALFVAVLPITSHAQTPVEQMPKGEYELDKGHASLIWKVSHLGLSDYTARFTNFDATITLNPTSPEKSSLVATVDPTSIETDYPGEKNFDEELINKEQWFNASQYPVIKFESTSIEKTGDNTGIITGDLTFLGVTKPMTLDVTFNKAMEKQPFSGKPTLGFSATGTLERSKWGMDTYVPNIGDKVELLIEVEFAKAN